MLAGPAGKGYAQAAGVDSGYDLTPGGGKALWVRGIFQITLPVGTTYVQGHKNLYSLPAAGPRTSITGWLPFSAGFSSTPTGLPVPLTYSADTQKVWVTAAPPPAGLVYQYDVMWRYTPGHPLFTVSSSGPVTVR